MALHLSSRRFWSICTAVIIAAGILSRLVHTGFPVFDKYLGDALYAAMVYAMMRLLTSAAVSAVCAAAIMTAIELFQLSLIPAHMLASERLVIRICARLLGVQFSSLDLLAYAVGIACIYLWDSSRGSETAGHPETSEGVDAELATGSGWRTGGWRHE